RLERMRGDAALLAIKGPLPSTGRSFVPNVAENLVQELLETRVENAVGQMVPVKGEFVEPVQLQAVCQNLWRNLPADVKVITAAHRQHCADVDAALKNLYESAVQAAVRKTGANEEEL